MLLLCQLFEVAAAENIADPAFDFAFMEPAVAQPLTAAEAQQILTVNGSAVTYTMGERRDKFRAVDWFPEQHQTAPALVTRGRAPDVSACGRCHTVTGTGKPENASIAGLDKDYLVRQLKEMRSGHRVHPRVQMQPSAMFSTAAHLSDQDIHIVSQWYSDMAYQTVLTVQEAEEVPPVANIGWLWALEKNGQPRKTAGRILEVARDGPAFEKADLRAGIIAYVPVGALARGRQLAENGAPGIPACQSCHGAGLRGGIAPALAGRYPNYMIRQILGFANGRRSGAYAPQMTSFAQHLRRDDMIAVAAFAASLTP